MAIQIRRVLGADTGVVSVALNASVSTSPSKLTITSFKGTKSNNGLVQFGGIRFKGELISKNTHYEQGKMGLVTEEFIDSSIRLDRNNIVLFRRGMPSRKIVKYKKVTIPTLSIVSSIAGLSLRVDNETTYEIGVERHMSAGSNILGEEEWSANPCESSSVFYKTSDALGLIGVSGGGSQKDKLVSYEGSYRSVLGSICGDLGTSYWCDWSTGKIEMIDISNGFSVPSFNPLSPNCGILSADVGYTKQGTASAAAWVGVRPKNYEFKSDTVSLNKNSSFIVSPTKHRDYPSDDEILYSICPAYKKYQLGEAAFGFQQTNVAYIPSLVAGIYDSDDATKSRALKMIWGKFGFNPKKNLDWNIKWKLNLIKDDGQSISKDCTNSGRKGVSPAAVLPEVLDGYFIVAKGLTEDAPATKMELFYPYEQPVVQNLANGMQFSSIKHEYDPSPSQRLAFDAEPDSGDVTDNDGSDWGMWRSVSPWIDPESDTDATDFDDAVNDICREVDHNLLCDVLDAMVSNNIIVSVPFNLRCAVELSGEKLLFIQRPRYSIDFTLSDGEIHPDDEQETVDYIASRQVLSDYDNVEKYNAMLSNKAGSASVDVNSQLCADRVQRKQAELQSNFENQNNDDTGDAISGLLSANGREVRINCNGKTIRAIVPGLNPFKVVRRTTMDLLVNTRVGDPTSNTSWNRSGSTSGSTVLSHAVNITEVDNPDDAEVDAEASLVPSQYKTKEKLNTLSAVCDGFYFPADPTMSSLSANLEMGQLVVSYSFQELPAAPPQRPFLKHSYARNTI